MSSARRAPSVALAWVPVCAYTLLIWWLSSQSLNVKWIERIPWQDKGVHFVEYALLGLLMGHAARISWPAQRLRYLAALWITCCLGLVDELHQLYVPGRSADAADLVADALGATLGTALAALWARRRAR